MARPVPTKLIAAAAAFMLLCLFTQALWRPWLSPRYAAQQLAGDDGRGLTIFSQAASKFWGPAIYPYLRQATANFEDFDYYISAYAVLEILLDDSAASAILICRDLLKSSSEFAEFVGYAACSYHGEDMHTWSNISEKVLQRLTKLENVDDPKVLLALQVVKLSKLEGAVNELRRQLLRDDVPYWTAVGTCEALREVPEKIQAEQILQEALERPRFFAKQACLATAH